MRVTFYVRDHLTNMGTIRHLLVLRLANIQAHGGESPPTEDCIATMAALEALCCGSCNLHFLYKRLGMLIDDGQTTISHADLLKLMTGG